MLWIIIGMLLGASWAWQADRHPVLAGPLHAVTDALTDFGNRGMAELVRGVGLGADSRLQHVAGAVMSVIAPALVCLLLAEAAVLGQAARRAAMLLLAVGAIASFWFLPVPQALLLLATAIGVGLLLAFAGGILLDVPVAAAVTAVCTTVLLGVAHRGAALSRAAAVLADAGGSVQLWRVALAALTVTVAVGAIARLITRPS